MHHASEEHALTQKRRQNFTQMQTVFFISTLWSAWQALIGEGEGGIQAREREGRARGKISPRAAISLSLFSFSLSF